MRLRKSAPVLVKPLTPTTAPSGKINLSPFDKGFVGMAPSSLLVFEHPIHEPAETIKKALSLALVHYYPIAGRVVYAGGGGGDDDEEAHIHCNDEGVAFVAPSTSCALKDVEFLGPSPDARMEASPVDKLAIYYPPAAAGECGPADPLLLMQVTQFSCGGFILVATWNHGVADGAGMAQFLQAVAELSLGSSSSSSLSILPLRWGGSIMSIHPSEAELALQHVTASIEPILDLAFLGITIPSSSVNRIKAEFLDASNGQPCTVFEAITAVLWQCRTRAAMSNPDSPSMLHFVVNVRKHVGAKDGYYGNCIRPQPVVKTSGAVANASVVDLVKMIKRAKEEIHNQFKKEEEEDSDDQLMSSLQPSMLELDQQQMVDLQYNVLAVTSWRNLGFEKVDFGAGTPARVLSGARRRLTFPLCVVSPPCKGKGGDDGHDVFCFCVKEKHVAAFLRELARFT